VLPDVHQIAARVLLDILFDIFVCQSHEGYRPFEKYQKA
jgi:hypothetical protein